MLLCGGDASHVEVDSLTTSSGSTYRHKHEGEPVIDRDKRILLQRFFHQDDVEVSARNQISERAFEVRKIIFETGVGQNSRYYSLRREKELGCHLGAQSCLQGKSWGF